MRVERALYRRQRHTHSPASVTTRAWVVVGEQPAASLVVWSFHSYSARRSIVQTPTSSWRPNDRHSTQRISRGGQSRRFSGRYCAHTHTLTHSQSTPSAHSAVYTPTTKRHVITETVTCRLRPLHVVARLITDIRCGQVIFYLYVFNGLCIDLVSIF